MDGGHTVFITGVISLYTWQKTEAMTPTITIEELAEKVTLMRHWQRRYFILSRSSPKKQDALEESKRYEHQVDTLLARLNTPPPVADTQEFTLF